MTKEKDIFDYYPPSLVKANILSAKEKTPYFIELELRLKERENDKK